MTNIGAQRLGYLSARVNKCGLMQLLCNRRFSAAFCD